MLLILSVLVTIPTSYARDADPCDDIVGKWVGRVIKSGYCDWDVTATGEKYKYIVRMQWKFSNGKSSDEHTRCNNITVYTSGRCHDAEIKLDEFSGTIFGGVLELRAPGGYYARLHKQ